MEFAREMAGDRGDVSLLLPPGAEVHTWQPRVSDIRKLAASDLFIYIGRGLEPGLKNFQKRGPARAEDDRGEPGPWPDHRKESTNPMPDIRPKRSDPHVWLDFGMDQMIIDGFGPFSRTSIPKTPPLTMNAAASL